MNTALNLASGQMPSSIFGGIADADYASAFTSLFNNVKLTADRLLDGIGKWFNDNVAKNVVPVWDFLKGWWKDDPVGATAGILLGGVIVIVGGKLLGAGAGLVGALKSTSWLVRAGLLVGSTAVIGSLIRFAVRGVQYLWNFNWNVTDKELRQQQLGLLGGLYRTAGTAVGTGLASLLCGTAPVKLLEQTKMVKVNPMMLAKIKEISEFDPQSDGYGELYDEFMQSLKALVQIGIRSAAQWMFIESFKNIRKWIKNSANPLIKRFFPGMGRLIDKWGEEGSQAWSFASATEKAIESIQDENLKGFTEEMVESFMDTCTENAMVISYVF